MDKNNEQEVKTFRQGTRNTLKTDRIRTSLLDQTLNTGLTIRLMGDHMINTKTNLSPGIMEISPELDRSTIEMEKGEVMATIPVLHLTKTKESHRVLHAVNLQLINPAIPLLTDPINNQAVVSHLMKKKLSQNNPISTNMIHFATPDDSSIELWDLWPLNYQGLPIKIPINLKNLYFASTFSTLPAEKLENSGLELELVLDTGFLCSLFNYWTFSEVC